MPDKLIATPPEFEGCAVGFEIGIPRDAPWTIFEFDLAGGGKARLKIPTDSLGDMRTAIKGALDQHRGLHVVEHELNGGGQAA